MAVSFIILFYFFILYIDYDRTGTKEWEEERNRRWYLESLANKKGFDPLKTEGWISFLGSQKSTDKVIKLN